MITTIQQALTEVEAIRMDYVSEYGDEGAHEIDHGDIVASAAHGIEDDDLVRELCRVELGYVPFDLEGRLGKHDWCEA